MDVKGFDVFFTYSYMIIQGDRESADPFNLLRKGKLRTL